MHMKRNRSLTATTGLVTALSLGLLVACTPAKFNANPLDPNQPGGQTASGVNAAGTGLTVQGSVSLNGLPLAGAQIKAVDAVTGRALNIIAAGAGNIIAGGGGNIIAGGGGNLTDAQGNFSVTVAGLAPGHVAQIVANGQGGSLSALVGGKSANNYQVTEVVTIRLTASTTAAANAYLPLLKLFAANPALVKTILSDATGAESRLQAFFGSHAEAAQALFTATNTSGLTSSDTLKLTLQQSGEGSRVTATAQTVAEQAAASNTSVLTSDVPGETLTAIGIQVLPNGQIQIGDKVVTLPTGTGGTPTNGGTTVTPNADGTVTVEGSDGADDSSAAQEPTEDHPEVVGEPFIESVSVGYTGDYATSSDIASTNALPELYRLGLLNYHIQAVPSQLTLSYSQSKGSADVRSITTRLPVEKVGSIARGANGSIFATGHTSNPVAVDGGYLEIVRDQTIVDPVELDPEFGGGIINGSEPGSIRMRGYLYNGHAHEIRVASVQGVYDGYSVYLKFNYVMDGILPDRNQGGVTTLTTEPNAVTLTGPTKATVVVKSRRRSTTTFSKTVAQSS